MLYLAGYITEKIMNGLLADTVPIYWGAPDISEYFNMDRIVHCGALEGSEGLKKFRSLPRPRNATDGEQTIQQGRELLREAMKPCIDEVLELENNPERFIWKISQPILPGNGKIEGSYFDLDHIASKAHSVMSVYDSPLVEDVREKFTQHGRIAFEWY